MTALNSDEARALRDLIDVLEGKLAGLAAIVSQLPGVKDTKRVAAKRDAEEFMTSPYARRHAEKIIDDITR